MLAAMEAEQPFGVARTRCEEDRRCRCWRHACPLRARGDRCGPGRLVGEPVTLKTAEHGSFQLAWQEFGRRAGIELPNELAIAFAGPVGGEVLKLTNNPWVIRPALIKERLGVDRYTVVNDFGAVAYAVATLGDDAFPASLRAGAVAAEARRDLNRRPRHRSRRRRAAAGRATATRSSRPRAAMSISRRSTVSRTISSRSCGGIFAGCRSSGSRPGKGCGTSTRRSARSRTSTSRSTTTRSCGRRRWTAGTASQPRRSTGSA